MILDPQETAIVYAWSDDGREVYAGSMQMVSTCKFQTERFGMWVYMLK